MHKTDVLIIGAGASGLMCAIEAGKRRRKVVVLDHNDKPGRKLLITGGGRCNFTNLSIDARNYISHNPHFCKSALSRYTQQDFLVLIKKHGIAYTERDHGQLFCADSAGDILAMLLTECEQVGVRIQCASHIDTISHLKDRLFEVNPNAGPIQCTSLVVATGGLSMPSVGAGPLGYKIAEQFGIQVQPVSAGLVPLTTSPEDKARFSSLSGIALRALVRHGQHSFCDQILFTHRGLSGPAVLQISNYWQPGQPLEINLLPEQRLAETLESAKQTHPGKQLKTYLSQFLAKRLIKALIEDTLAERRLRELTQHQISLVAEKLQHWTIKPGGTEGYRTAEVTLGGVDCHAISSKTMESRQVPGLYFIGEVLDVTGWLGGYNLQWAWSSGWCAGQAV